MINVENGKIVGWVGEGFVYVGRYNGKVQMKESNLKNKFVIGKDGDRTEVVEKYRNWLWEIVKEKNSRAWNELLELVKRYKSGEDLTLLCWGKPYKCHADVIRNCVEYLSKQS